MSKKPSLDLRYFTERRRADGTYRFFWQPSRELKARDYKLKRLAVGTDDRLTAEIECDRINKELDRAVAAGDHAAAAALTQNDRTLDALLELYKASDDWKNLGDATRQNYEINLALTAAVFGDVDVKLITSEQVMSFLSKFAHQPAKRHALYRNFRTLLYFGVYKRWLVANPAARLKKIPRPKPRVVIWTREEIPALVELADRRGEHELGDAIAIMAETALRRGDVVTLEPRHWNAERRMFTVKPSKTAKTTGIVLDIPATPFLGQRMAKMMERRRSMTVVPPYLIPRPGTIEAWHPSTFTHAFEDLRNALAVERPEGQRHVVKKDETIAQFAARCGTTIGALVAVNKLNDEAVSAGRELLVPTVSTKHLGDFRDTAVTRLARAGNTIPFICSITGHSLQSAYNVLRHYLSITGDMAEEAIRRMVAYENEAGSKL